MCVQYIGRCSLHRGDGGSAHRGIPGVHRGDIMSTSGDVQYIGRYHDLMWGSKFIKAFHLYCKPRCTEHSLIYLWYPPHASWYPPMYSWYPPMYWTSLDVLMIPPDVLMVYPDVLNIPDVFIISPYVFMISSRFTEHTWCTHDIPPMYSWYTPMCWTSPMYSWYPPMYSWYLQFI